MSAAAFVLSINLFIAAVFALAFGVVAAYQKTSDSARWVSAAYALGVFNVVLEFLLPSQSDHRLASIAIFLDFLIASTLLVVGVARHYRARVPWRMLGGICLASSVTILVIVDWPRESMARMMLYQTPYALVMLTGAWVLVQRRVHRPLDVVLTVLLLLSALQFLAKPFLAVSFGAGERPQDYIHTLYAALSQTLGAFLLLANGLMLLLIQVRDLMDEMTARSETDRLSGLYNRRGFEDRVGPGMASLARAGLPGAMIIADLDRFKEINDTHGHDCGDRVIAAFARVLAEAAGDHFVVGRLGGEEFAVFMPGVEATGARLFAESVRTALANRPFDFLPDDFRPTVSIGVAQIAPGESQSDALRRADAALYEAKRAGRDTVRVAPSASDAMPQHPMERRRYRSGSRG